jgi:hypothetical protein
VIRSRIVSSLFRHLQADETILTLILSNRRKAPWRHIHEDVMTASKTQERETMIRKTLLALTATVAVGAAMLAPTAASAWPKHHHHFHGLRGVGLGFAIAAPIVATSCYRYQWIETRRGLRRILVNTCAY